MSYKILCILGVILINFTISSAQEVDFKKYSYDVNSPYFNLNISFDIPEHWVINVENDGTGYQRNCTSTLENEIIHYKECSDGIIFRIKYLYGDLDTALQTMGLVSKSDNLYLTTFDQKIKILVSTPIENNNYYGLHYTLSHEIKCKNKKGKKDAKYQHIYFSNDTYTIGIITNGEKLPEKVFERILSSFRFH